MKYFIGNWKMFGVPKSISILKKLNKFASSDKNKNKYKVIVTPPFTLIESFANYFKNKKISIGSQNCYQKDQFSSNTAAISPYMIKNVGAKYTLVGHSDNRGEGDTDKILKDKVKFSSKNNLNIVFCIGENKSQKNKKQTFKILKKQLANVLEKRIIRSNIIIAYEPVWSIGTGIIPNNQQLKKTIIFIKDVVKKILKKKSPIVLYGGSVDEKTFTRSNK